MSVDNLKECGLKGSFLGLVLMMSSILTMSFINDIKGMVMIFPFFPIVVIVYLLIGNLLWYLHIGPSGGYSSWLSGAAVNYLILPFAMLVSLLPKELRYIILVNIAVLVFLWFVDYLSLKKIADELNHGMPVRKVSLVVDLNENPATMEAYFNEIEKYCASNKWELEFVKKEKPALVRIDGKSYRVKLGLYYTPIGTPVYTMTFSSVNE